jgi:DNA (cytosine-5)-methyltransferase 1
MRSANITGFAGAGGWCEGARQAGLPIDLAYNHWETAIRLHSANHPHTRHFCEDVRKSDIRADLGGRRVGWIHVSPDCTHFSRAKGKQPRRQEIRGLAWTLAEWAEQTEADVLSLENVPEFLTWGDLDEDGQPIVEQEGVEFRAFVDRLRALGYRPEWREFCMADYGVPTIRRRLLLMARRDGRSIRWPQPTHGPGLLPYRTAAECIDWSVPAPSIFTRLKPLAEATCRRIAAGVTRFAQPVGGQGKVLAWLAKHYTGVVGQGLDRPLGTITAIDHHALCVARTGHDRHPGARRVAAFLTSYYSGGGTSHSLAEPMPTVTATARHGLVCCTMTGRAIVDIGMRMLTPRELARGMGFTSSYILEPATIAEQIRAIGNSVPPPFARAIVAANIVRRDAG